MDQSIHTAGTFRMDKGRLYRMPVVFGPQHGPRQFPDGITADHANYPKRRMASIDCVVDEAALAALLPEGFSIRGEPVLTFELTHITELEWLAGRGYAILGVKAPVRYVGRDETVDGDFQLVYWENLADPIISGRDEIGAPKIYCEIPEPQVFQGAYTYHCAWQGFRLFSLTLSDLREITPSQVARAGHQGLMYYKYCARTGLGLPDADYVTLSPAGNTRNQLDRLLVGQGRANFHAATWSDLPTMHHIVNRFAQLDIKEFRNARLVFSHGGRDFGDTRVITAAAATAEA
jgi:Acetoacetate decarboxylase (ADC)